MHVAFPSSEIFRCLAVREPLLRGLLAADLIGFQTANFARHFRHTVSRILSYESLPKGIQVEGGGTSRFVDVGVFPMGIDFRALREKRCAQFFLFCVVVIMYCRQEPEVADWVEMLKQRYAGMKIIVGRDRLEEVQVNMTSNLEPAKRDKIINVQGVKHKMQAFEIFLEKYTEFQEQVILFNFFHS
jgi:trehalose-6-phosphate synthase